MDITTLIERATKNTNPYNLQIALLECIRMGESGLPYVVTLATSDYESISWSIEYRQVSMFTCMFWGEEGINSLYKTIHDTPSDPILMSITCILGYASSYNLHHASSLHLHEYPQLINKLSFLDEIYHSGGFVGRAVNSLFDLVQSMRSEEIAPGFILQAMLRLSMEGEYLNSFGAYNNLFRAYASRWLRQNDFPVN